MATKEKTGDKLRFDPRGDSVRLSRRAFLRMAETTVGAIQMRGFFTMFGICSMEVPRP